MGGGSGKGSSGSGSSSQVGRGWGFTESAFSQALNRFLTQNTQTAMTGMTTGTTTQDRTSPWAAPLANLGQAYANAGLPALKLYGAQSAEALRTGGVNAQIPIINRQMDAARQALSGSTTQIRQNLGRTGLGGTGAGQDILAQSQQQGAESLARIPTDVASQFIAGTPGMATAAGGVGTGALAQAGALQGRTTGSFATQQEQYSREQMQQRMLQDIFGRSGQNNWWAGVNVGNQQQQFQPSFWDTFSQGFGLLSGLFGGR